MSEIRVGILGCGNIAQNRYLPSLQVVPGISLYGVYDINEGLQQHIVAEYNCVSFESAEAMFACPEVDAVFICTIPSTHRDLCLAALAAGKHVLVEKPIALDAASAKEMYDAAHQSKKIVMALPFNGYPYMELCRNVLEQELIGKVVAIDGMMAHAGPNHAPWYYDKARNKWGVLSDLGIYVLSLFVALQGPVAAVSASTDILQPKRISGNGEEIAVTVEDTCSAVLRMENGVCATMRCNWNTGTPWGTNVWDYKFYGTKGIMFLNMFSSDVPFALYRPAGAPAGFEPIKYAGINCFAPSPMDMDMCTDIVSGFVQAVNGKRTVQVLGSSIDTQYNVIRTIEAMYTSADQQRWIVI